MGYCGQPYACSYEMSILFFCNYFFTYLMIRKYPESFYFGPLRFRASGFDTDQVALRVSRREDGILTQSGRMLRFPAV